MHDGDHGGIVIPTSCEVRLFNYITRHNFSPTRSVIITVVTSSGEWGNKLWWIKELRLCLLACRKLEIVSSPVTQRQIKENFSLKMGDWDTWSSSEYDDNFELGTLATKKSCSWGYWSDTHSSSSHPKWNTRSAHSLLRGTCWMRRKGIKLDILYNLVWSSV